MIVEEINSQQQEDQTLEIPTIPRLEEVEGPSVLCPKCLFPPEQNADVRFNQAAVTTPKVKKRKHHVDTRTKVCTATKKKVLSSDVRLHLQKIQQRKAQKEAEMDGGNCSNEELKLLEQETKRLQDKLEKHKEIRRLQLELQQTSISYHPSEDDDDEDYEYEEDRST